MNSKTNHFATTRDVLHLYYGAHCEYEWTAGLHKEIGSTRARISTYLIGLRGVLIRPILRPLWSITHDEYQEYIRLEDRVQEHIKLQDGSETPYYEIRSRAFSPRTLVFLLSRGFDLFDLIDTGQAIDATKLEVNPYLHESN